MRSKAGAILGVLIVFTIISVAFFSESMRVETEQSAPVAGKKTNQPHQPDTIKRADQDPTTPVWVTGPRGQPENIRPTLNRIERRESFPHRNDGGIFQNREKRLPIKKRGYYHEFVHPTKGKKGPGAQRIVKGEEREIYYTPDHYETFQEVPGDD